MDEKLNQRWNDSDSENIGSSLPGKINDKVEKIIRLLENNCELEEHET